MYTVSQLYIYPIKSLGGIELPAAQLTSRGFLHDRRWMLVDEHGVFLSQRSYAKLALFTVSFLQNGFGIAYQHSRFSIPFQLSEGNQVCVTIWDDTCDAIVHEAGSEWFSEQLQRNVQLVYMPDDALRKVDENYAANNEGVSFADAYPFLLIGQQSLNALNQKLTVSVEMNRFRPNIVFTGGLPHDEDRFVTMRIGEAMFKGVKPCARCTVTTINQQTAEQGKEPLATLATYRNKDSKILFGQNVLCDAQEGIIRVGDTITVHSLRDSLVFA